MDIDLSAMEVGDSVLFGVGEWGGQPETDWAEVMAYVTKHWPVQFEVTSAWKLNERGIQEMQYTLTRIR